MAEKNSREGTPGTGEDAEGFNLISFHKPACTNSPFTVMPDNDNSKKLMDKPTANSSAYRQCASCIRDVNLQGTFCPLCDVLLNKNKFGENATCQK